jgi:hypothetical protein
MHEWTEWKPVEGGIEESMASKRQACTSKSGSLPHPPASGIFERTVVREIISKKRKTNKDV